MKYCFTIVLSFWVCISFAQDKFFIEAHASAPLLLNDNLRLQEDGIGYVDFNYEGKMKPEFGVSIGMISKNERFRFGLGASIKHYENRWSYKIYDPSPQGELLQERDEVVSIQFIGVNFFSSFKLTEKLKVRLTIEMNDPVRYRRQDLRNLGLKDDFTGVDPESGESYTYRLKKLEFYNFSRSPYSYVIPELSIHYNINNFIEFFGGINWKYNNNDVVMYKLYLKGRVPGYSDKTYVLNDTNIYNKFLFLNFGVNYQFDFGKRSK